MLVLRRGGGRWHGEASQTILDQAHKIILTRSRELLATRFFLRFLLLDRSLARAIVVPRGLLDELLEFRQLPLGRAFEDLVSLHRYTVFAHRGLVSLHLRMTLDDEVHRATDRFGRLFVMGENWIRGQAGHGSDSRCGRYVFSVLFLLFFLLLLLFPLSLRARFHRGTVYHFRMSSMPSVEKRHGRVLGRGRDSRQE